MEIKREIKKINIEDHFTSVKVSVGELTLGIGKDGTLTLVLKTNKNVVHLLCDHFKRLGNINRYARCYGVEFVR